MSDAARARGPHLEDLVDLFLIFRDGCNNLDFAKEMLKLLERCAWIGRHCVGPEQRNRKHALV